MAEFNPGTCTFVFESGDDLDFTRLKILKFKKEFSEFPFFVTCFENKNPHQFKILSGEFEPSKFIILSCWKDLLKVLKTSFLAFVPARADYYSLEINNIILADDSIIPWIPTFDLADDQGARMMLTEIGWIGPIFLLTIEIELEKSISLKNLQNNLEKSNTNICYRSIVGKKIGYLDYKCDYRHAKISRSSTVLAIVPHFNCNIYLEQCLFSLTHQSRSLDGIVVVDDNSDIIPIEIVRKFKNVTLLKSNKNVGPYRLIQSVIDQTVYDAFLFQDADDWSSSNRLEILLEQCEKTCAELIGTQELMFFENGISLNRYPLNVHGALAKGPSYALLHPSSLVSRDFVQRLGGYSTGLKFSGDLEFLNRAFHAGLIENVNVFAYFRRMRQGSLTLSPVTGLSSMLRKDLHHRIRTKAWDNLKKVSRGESPDLLPLEQSESVFLEWVIGPKIFKN